jgi:AcrR family transcriptional regulator
VTTVLPTRDRLLDAAERLFAEHGFDGASMRQITSGAEANLAAVNYHFGTKLALIHAVFARRLGPLNAERIRLLDALLESAEQAGDERPPLRGIMHAFLAPALSLGRKEGREFFVLIARAHSAPSRDLQEAIVSQLGEVVARFGAALQSALPDLPKQELMWRVHFTIGALCHTVVNTHLLTLVTNGLCTDEDEAAVLERLVDFATAGMLQGEAS